jgi:thymidylate synthase ThyX
VLRDKEFRTFLNHAEVPADEKIKSVEAVLPDVHPLIRNLLNVLITKGLANLAPELSDAYTKLLDIHHGRQRIEVISAVELEDAGLAQPYHAAMAQAAATFEAIAVDYPHEAQYVVPMAYRIRWAMHINLRALLWLVELRSTPQGHPGYRHIAQELFREVKRVQPRLAEWMKFVDLDSYALGRLDAEVRQESKSP